MAGEEEGEAADIGWIRKNLGFVADPHRICVGITRSKHGLVIVGEIIIGLHCPKLPVTPYTNADGRIIIQYCHRK